MRSKPLVSLIAAAIAAVTMQAAHAKSEDDEPEPKSGGPNALEQPAITGPLQPNPNPAAFTAGPLGTINVSGVVTGYGLLCLTSAPVGQIEGLHERRMAGSS